MSWPHSKVLMAAGGNSQFMLDLDIRWTPANRAHDPPIKEVSYQLNSLDISAQPPLHENMHGIPDLSVS